MICFAFKMKQYAIKPNFSRSSSLWLITELCCVCLTRLNTDELLLATSVC